MALMLHPVVVTNLTDVHLTVLSPAETVCGFSNQICQKTYTAMKQILCDVVQS